MLSLGSTGFTTVEEMEGLKNTHDGLCGIGAKYVFEAAIDDGHSSDEAAEQAQLYYNMCTHFDF